MASSERAADRGSRQARRDVASVGDELRRARRLAGLSLVAVGRATGLSYSQVSRVERATLATVSVMQLAKIGSVVGLDVRVRAYPAGPPIRDAAQVALLERFRARLGPGLRMRLEVPLELAGDQRAWDAMLTGPTTDSARMPGVDPEVATGPGPSAVTGQMAVEAITRLDDVQATLRKIALKQRDGDISQVILLLADTRSNRAARGAATDLLRAAFPCPTRTALACLKVGSLPPASTLLVL